MPLVRYSTYLYYPAGGEAANFTTSVKPRASNQLALLFSDEFGASPLVNPATTDDAGLLSFYAAPGDYQTMVAGVMVDVPVDASVTEPVWPNLYIHNQTTPAQVWTIDHHLGVRPLVDVVLSEEGGEEVSVSEVRHTGHETTVITFGTPTTGTAHLRR